MTEEQPDADVPLGNGDDIESRPRLDRHRGPNFVLDLQVRIINEVDMEVKFELTMDPQKLIAGCSIAIATLLRIVEDTRRMQEKGNAS